MIKSREKRPSIFAVVTKLIKQQNAKDRRKNKWEN